VLSISEKYVFFESRDDLVDLSSGLSPGGKGKLTCELSPGGKGKFSRITAAVNEHGKLSSVLTFENF